MHQQALDDVVVAKQYYDEAWRARETARAELGRLHRDHRETHQKAWVQQHRPELVQAVDHWQEHLRTATSDRAHAQAKKEYAAAMFAYQQAVAQAPYTSNGTAP